MIQPLRRRHLMIWTVLAALLAALFAAGVLERRSTTPENPGIDWGHWQ